jgi:hypothetical protein
MCHGDTDRNGASIGEQIINAVRDGDAGGVGAEVVIVDQAGRQVPAGTGGFEMADEFALVVSTLMMDRPQRANRLCMLRRALTEGETAVLMVGQPEGI